MSILIDSTQFTDAFGNTTPFYVANAGDELSVTMDVRSSIRMTSVGNPLTLDPSVNQVLSPQIGWLDEGFRVGDWVHVFKHNSGGSINNAWYTQIAYVDNVMCDFGSMPFWYSIVNNEFVTMYVVVGNLNPTLVIRDDLEIDFNHVKNATPGSIFSLIDGEASRIQFPNVNSLILNGAALSGILVGFQSGQFIKEATIKRITPIDIQYVRHQIVIVFDNSGMFGDDQNWFFSSGCIKSYIKYFWARLNGEPFARAEALYNADANTGFFDEPNNSSLLDATLISGISEIDYCLPTNAQIIVEGPLLEIGMGAVYRSIDSGYYQNKVTNQRELSMIIPTTEINNFFAPVSSEVNPSGAGFDIVLTNLVQLLGQTIIDITITPNAAFTTFMTNADDGDRLFYLWVKCGNLNLLAYADQLVCAPPVGGPLIMEQDYGYLDHSQNVTSIVGDQTGFIADTEDDVAYLGTFLLTKNEIYENFSVKIEAFNITSENDFTLQEVSFGFGAVQISGDGRYLLNESAAVVSTLPNTSVKLSALLVLEPSLDTPTQYGVKIYAPWLLNWKYWLTQSGVDADFYPTQNKNWEQYDNLGDWILRTELQLIKDGLAYVHDNQIIVEPYDNEPDIVSEIEMEIEATATIVNVIPIGDLMRIRATHTNLLGAWGVNTWGMITVEPFQQNPRWICSTVVPFDNNTQNPLLSETGLTITIQYPSPNVAVFECLFDSAIIDLSGGVKFTSKIKDPDLPPIPYEFMVDAPKDAQLMYSTAYKLSPNTVYSGACMRVRRGLDDAEMDIPFNNVELDQNILLGFVGINGRGWIVTLYDQSGNDIDASTLVHAKQPKIVEFGAVILGINGKPAADCDGINDSLDLSITVPAQPYLTAHWVFDRLGTSINNISLTSSNVSPFVLSFNAVDRVVDLIGAVANQWQVGSDLSTGNMLLTIQRDGIAPFVTIVNKDGVAMPNSPINVAPVGGDFDSLLGRQSPATFNKGKFQEFILFSNDQSANLVTQENNIKTRYNIL